jgi:hypothetical protein
MIAAHADWSTSPGKRWISIARRAGDGWRLGPPEPVGDPATLLERLRGPGRVVALGVDLPLGVPRDYARTYVQETDFPAFLCTLAGRPLFFDVCPGLAEIAPERPFYPARPAKGMTRAGHAAALGLTTLSRLCDRATAIRPAGAPLFWTLGANQTGKAAIAAWRDMLVPAMNGPNPPALWPFMGDFKALLSPERVAIAETYPAEALRHLGLQLRGSKRRQADRAALAGDLRARLLEFRVSCTAEMIETIEYGFGPAADGEDRFDSLLGLLCVLNVLAGNRPDGIPDDPWLRRWEGWVLGQTELPRDAERA